MPLDEATSGFITAALIWKTLTEHCWDHVAINIIQFKTEYSHQESDLLQV